MAKHYVLILCLRNLNDDICWRAKERLTKFECYNALLHSPKLYGGQMDKGFVNVGMGMAMIDCLWFKGIGFEIRIYIDKIRNFRGIGIRV